MGRIRNAERRKVKMWCHSLWREEKIVPNLWLQICMFCSAILMTGFKEMWGHPERTRGGLRLSVASAFFLYLTTLFTRLWIMLPAVPSNHKVMSVKMALALQRFCILWPWWGKVRICEESNILHFVPVIWGGQVIAGTLKNKEHYPCGLQSKTRKKRKYYEYG